MKKQLDIFFTALMFYTRIPCPKNITHDPTYLNKATRYFPLIGYIVGGIGAIVFALSYKIFYLELAILFSLLANVLTTGAFHEDGFADVCDGFGGGWTKEKILKIMKDSAIGAYGAIGLVLLFAIKFFALKMVLNEFITHPYIQDDIVFVSFLFFIVTHSLSRLTAISIIFTTDYVREDELSKSKPIAKQNTWKEIVGAFVFGLIPFLKLISISWCFLYLLIPLILTNVSLTRYFKKWIGGYTGDCLGATQQIAEVVFYLSFIALWKFI
ncbi:adenosylcobinamide-GDP ribazoletransferase [Flavobacterium facile]|uniref:adenosylcobinamide-GDP ribazoletransferase n=1 Tax=Flavobacterium facile TaxID=2893174 RepID=UPI002E79D468|nr:adenosylcobinamide-GDP ribazoletransferase [Flavobacterium sp. T-12]